MKVSRKAGVGSWDSCRGVCRGPQLTNGCVSVLLSPISTNPFMNVNRRSGLVVFSALGLAVILTGCPTPSAAQSPEATPCMTQLNCFTAANVPALGPDDKLFIPRRQTPRVIIFGLCLLN
jgi:hypothetical protein